MRSRRSYANLRLMLSRYPYLAVILIVHVRKPAGRGAGGRQLSDVLGEWGRWCDVVVLQENDGKSLDRAKLTTRKRVRHQRRIVATKAGGLAASTPSTSRASPTRRSPRRTSCTPSRPTRARRSRSSARSSRSPRTRPSGTSPSSASASRSSRWAPGASSACTSSMRPRPTAAPRRTRSMRRC